jgi:8-oxo-dGTP pyrophosphatase MutT (NUDIX family)
MIRPWPKTASRPLGDFRIFQLRSDQRVSPRTGQAHDFVVLEARDWVNIIALTPERQLVMLEQFRHGTETVELEVPGGVMDPHDASPVATAVRELREETGYEGRNARVLGQVFANPAILTNTCYTVLIDACVHTHPTQWDSGEDLLTRLVPADGVAQLLASGAIRHSLVMVALAHFDLWQRGLK